MIARGIQMRVRDLFRRARSRNGVMVKQPVGANANDDSDQYPEDRREAVYRVFGFRHAEKLPEFECASSIIRGPARV